MVSHQWHKTLDCLQETQLWYGGKHQSEVNRLQRGGKDLLPYKWLWHFQFLLEKHGHLSSHNFFLKSKTSTHENCRAWTPLAASSCPRGKWKYNWSTKALSTSIRQNKCKGRDYSAIRVIILLDEEIQNTNSTSYSWPITYCRHQPYLSHIWPHPSKTLPRWTSSPFISLFNLKNKIKNPALSIC